MSLVLSALIEYFVKPRFPTSYTLFEAIGVREDLKMVEDKLNSGADVKHKKIRSYKHGIQKRH